MLLLFICTRELFALDCHALQARNDAITLPLEDFTAILKGAGMSISHRFVSSRA
ncbi:MAG: hypothetical protein K9G11_03370 [Rickettsiaceae bacterium]|nr:hypothetical protein [Rickettsiaceae bacterium]